MVLWWHVRLSSVIAFFQILFIASCHEKPYSENPAQATHSDVTKFYAHEVEKAVDFFHFPGD